MNSSLTAHVFYVADLSDDLTFTADQTEVAEVLRHLGKESLLLTGVARGIYYRSVGGHDGLDPAEIVEAYFVTTPTPRASTRAHELL